MNYFKIKKIKESMYKKLEKRASIKCDRIREEYEDLMERQRKVNKAEFEEYREFVSTKYKERESILIEENKELKGAIKINNRRHQDEIKDIQEKCKVEMASFEKDLQDYLQKKEKELEERERKVVQSRKVMNEIFMSLVCTVGDTKKISYEISDEVYKYKSDLDELAKGILKVSDIVGRLDRKNKDIEMVMKKVCGVSTELERKSTKILEAQE